MAGCSFIMWLVALWALALVQGERPVTGETTPGEAIVAATSSHRRLKKDEEFCGREAPKDADDDETLWVVLEDTKELKYTVELVDRIGWAEINGTLDLADSWTLLMPTDDAWDALENEQEDLVNKLNRDGDYRQHLENLLSYHIVPGALVIEDLLAVDSEGTAVTTLLGETIVVSTKPRVEDIGRITRDTDANKNPCSDVYVDDAAIVEENLMATNGVIHIIDQVLLPPWTTRSILNVANEGMTILPMLWEWADMMDTMWLDDRNDTITYTLLAPTDDAWLQMSLSQVDFFNPNDEALQATLKAHLIEGVSTTDLWVDDDTELRTLSGKDVEVTSDDNGSWRLDEATVTQSDILANNGVVHMLDGVLCPDRDCERAREDGGNRQNGGASNEKQQGGKNDKDRRRKRRRRERQRRLMRGE